MKHVQWMNWVGSLLVGLHMIACGGGEEPFGSASSAMRSTKETKVESQRKKQETGQEIKNLQAQIKRLKLEEDTRSKQQKQINTDLLAAIREGDVSQVSVLLNQGAVPTKDKEKNSLLHLAIQHQHPALLAVLCERKVVDLDHRNAEGHTALDLVAMMPEDRVDLAKLLLETKLKGTTPQGFTSLHLAVLNKNFEVAKLLSETEGSRNTKSVQKAKETRKKDSFHRQNLLQVSFISHVKPEQEIDSESEAEEKLRKALDPKEDEESGVEADEAP